VSFSLYLLRRAVYMLIVLFVILSLNFVLFRLMPGDPVASMLDPRMSAAAKAKIEQRFGLQRSLPEQYFIYMKNLLRFDLGYSFFSQKPVIQEIMARLPNTLLLLGTAMLLYIPLGIIAGVFAASRRGSLADTLATSAGLFTYGVPIFFVQLLVLLILGFYLPELGKVLAPSPNPVLAWIGEHMPHFPIRGTISTPPPAGVWPRILDRAYHLILPVSTLVLLGFGSWALYTRNTMLDALSQDYIVTARAKGLSHRQVLYKHAFRNILPPIVTLILLALPSILSGAVITETIFSWYGIGRYLLDAVLQQDYPAAQGAFYFIALGVLVCNLIADILYGLVDPRIRVGEGAKS